MISYSLFGLFNEIKDLTQFEELIIWKDKKCLSGVGGVGGMLPYHNYMAITLSNLDPRSFHTSTQGHLSISRLFFQT